MVSATWRSNTFNARHCRRGIAETGRAVIKQEQPEHTFKRDASEAIQFHWAALWAPQSGKRLERPLWQVAKPSPEPMRKKQQFPSLRHRFPFFGDAKKIFPVRARSFSCGQRARNSRELAELSYFMHGYLK
jgi:hypothetical protein